MIIGKYRLGYLCKGLCTLIVCLTICAHYSCKKKDSGIENEVLCYNPTKVQSAYTKAKGFVESNKAAYIDGTLDDSKLGLYIDMMATEVRMEYYINIITLGKGATVTGDDGTKVTIDDELIRNYKEALCNETDDINKKL